MKKLGKRWASGRKIVDRITTLILILVLSFQNPLAHLLWAKRVFLLVGALDKE